MRKLIRRRRNGATAEAPTVTAASDAPIDARYRIDKWRAEFADAAVEHAYKRRTAPADARQLRIACFAWAAFVFLFFLPDLANLGPTLEFFVVFALRAAVSAILVICGLALVRYPSLASTGRLITTLQAIAWTSYFNLFFMYPGDATPYVLSMATICLMSAFVYLPNRFVLAVKVSVYAAVGIFASLLLARHSIDLLTAAPLMLITPILAGAVGAHRQHVGHRREYAILEELVEENRARQRLEAELKVQASTDPLTGLYNRRHYEALFGQEIKRVRRDGSSLSLCMLDLDHFKRINDTYGHDAGDIVLKSVAELCRRDVREVDVLGRLGGEEFVVLLPNTTATEAERIAERLRQRISELEITVGDERLRVTATIGLTDLQPQDQTAADLIRRADAALYEGKRHGRNRVCVAVPGTPRAATEESRERSSSGKAAAGTRTD